MGNLRQWTIIFCILLGAYAIAYADITQPLIIEEVDGSPSVPVWKIIFPNDSITDNADGTVTINLAAGPTSDIILLEGSATDGILLEGTSDRILLE